MADTNTKRADRLGIALGGGGMKGWAHVGVLHELDSLGLRPGHVAGTSAGALIGAYYAAGYTVDEMVHLMQEQKTASLFSLRFDGAALFDNDELRDTLEEQLGDTLIEDLPIPFAVVATDLSTGQEVVIDRGPVVPAVLASSAMPGIFAPVKLDGRLLVDGGICNNVPVSVLTSRGIRYTIAVRLHQDVDALDSDDGSEADESPTRAERLFSNSMWAERLAKTIRRESGLPNGLEVVSRVMDITLSKLERYRLEAYPADVLIQPPVAHVRTLAFTEEREDIFEAGREATRAHLDDLKRLVSRLA